MNGALCIDTCFSRLVHSFRAAQHGMLVHVQFGFDGRSCSRFADVSNSAN